MTGRFPNRPYLARPCTGRFPNRPYLARPCTGRFPNRPYLVHVIDPHPLLHLNKILLYV